MLEHVLPGSAIISGIAEEEKRTRQRPRGAAVPFRGEEFARVDIHRPSPWLCGRSGCWRWRAVRAPQFSPGVLASVKGRQGQGCSWVTARGVLASRLLPPGTPGLGPVRGRGKQEEGAGGGRRSGQGREDGPTGAADRTSDEQAQDHSSSSRWPVLAGEKPSLGGGEAHGARGKRGLGPDFSLPDPPAAPLLGAFWLSEGQL